MNRAIVITPPDPFLGLELVKRHLSVDDSDNDILIEAYIAAACGAIDGPGGWLGRCIGEQTLRVLADSFDCRLIPLEGPPLQSITSVKYDDTGNVEQTLDPALYSLDPDGVLRAAGATWPVAQTRAGAIRVDYVAGYETPPGAVVAAALLTVGDLYQNRETTDTGRVAQIPMSAAVDRLLSPYKVWSL